MDKGRLLTHKERDAATGTLIAWDNPGLYQALSRQDAKTAAIVRAEVEAATFRAVGEELTTRPKHLGFGRLAVAVSLGEIEALLAGQMPERWKRK